MPNNIGDNIIEKFHPHWIGYLNMYFVSIILAVLGLIISGFWFLILLGLGLFLLTEVIRKATTYYVLENGIAKGFLFFSSSRKTILYRNIQNIEIHQSFIERMFGVGDVGFDTSGSHTIEVEFKYIASPFRIERIVREKML